MKMMRKSASPRRRFLGHATPVLRTPPRTTRQPLLLPLTCGQLPTTHAHAARKPCRQGQRADCYEKTKCLRGAAMDFASEGQCKRATSGTRLVTAATGCNRSAVHICRWLRRQAPQATHATRQPARQLHESPVCRALPSRGPARAIAARVRASGRSAGRHRKRRNQSGRRAGCYRRRRSPHERRAGRHRKRRSPHGRRAGRHRRRRQGHRWLRGRQGRRAAARRIVAPVLGKFAFPAARRAECVTRAIAAAGAEPPGGCRHRHVLAV